MEEKQVFISYRRDDSGDVTGRIHEYLAKAFGEDALFFDVINSIPLGREFGEYISDAVSKVKVMLVVIGKQWANITDSDGKLRLENPDDWVRLEVEAGLARGKSFPVIPIFVQNSSLKEDQLPTSLKPLIKRNGIQVRREPDFKNDLEMLVEGITALGVPKLPDSNRINDVSRIVTADRGSIAIGGNAVGNTFNLGKPIDDEG